LERWVVAAKSANFQQIAGDFQIDPVIARLIRNREVIGNEAIEEYLHGTEAHLHAPSLFKDMEKVLHILEEKVAERKKIRIIGDYDIDGVCATYILLCGLRKINADVDADIPDRIKDGYGINEGLIQAAHEAGMDTILTCDNGISAAKQIQYGKELGMTVIVTDHHEVPYEEDPQGKRVYQLPPADAIVNPKQPDCRYPFQGLCGAGVAYQVVRALYIKYGVPSKELEELLVFAAIATVGDVMDLVGENRILVKEGLKRLSVTNHCGLQALIKVNQLEDKEITSYHIGFVLGPCMNAGGRLSTAKRVLELLECKDPEEAAVLAGDLKALNDSRKDMTSKSTEETIELIETTSLREDKVIVVYLPDCHESLAGIVAGRIREYFGKPAIVLTKTEKGVKGSGRSIETYHMFQALTACRDLLDAFGGHPMAAGLSLQEKQIPVLRSRLNDQCQLEPEDFITKVLIDVPMPVSYITRPLISQLHLLEPFGKGNTKPLFAQKNIKLMGCRIFGKNRNVVKMKAVDEQGFEMEAVYFGDGESFVNEISDKKMFSIAYYPTINSYMGKENIQIVIRNFM